MRIIPPVIGASGLIDNQQKNSVQQSIDTNVEVSYPASLDTNAWPDTFLPANLSCTAIRVGSLGSTPASQTVWTAADTQISHNLGKQPIGWIVVYKDKTCDVFASSTIKNDGQFIYLTCTDTSANVTLVIF